MVIYLVLGIGSLSSILSGFVMAECDGCQFPFKYDDKNYTKCVKLEEEDDFASCITNQTLFDNSSNWTDANSNNLGWKRCEEICDVECPTHCKLPFYFDGKKYEKCTKDKRQYLYIGINKPSTPSFFSTF